MTIFYALHRELVENQPVIDHDRNVTVYTDYDLAGRPSKKTHLAGTAHAYTGEVTYNDYELPHEFKEYVGASRTKYTTGFGYDDENRVTALNYGTGSVNYVYDSLGRVATRTVQPASTPIQTAYTYVPGGHGAQSTTGLIQTIVQGGVMLTYTYDDNGNVTSVSDGTKITGYVYDAIGQLIRVDDDNDATSGATGTTWTYAYDQGGNILEKKRYAYTAGTLGPVQETVVYSYDTTWKDKLIGYNGITIEYDAIGNPTKVGTKNGEVWDSDTWTYTWEKGRQLKQMSKTGTTASFVYNADGLRVQKTVNNVVTNYTLHGKHVVHLTQGSDSLHFWYDASGRPAVVEWNDGTNTAKYAYIQNLQGDIVGIVDGNGTEVVKYSYDAWGKVLSTTGSLAATLGTIQPFRYRGYVYDVETGLYYLRSRFYNPTSGRFINSDSINYVEYLLAFNLFSYCLNSPINRIDNSGKESEGFEAYVFTISDQDEIHLSETTDPNSVFTKLYIGTMVTVIHRTKEFYYVMYISKDNNISTPMYGYIPAKNVAVWFGGSSMRQYCDGETNNAFKEEDFHLRENNSYYKMNAIMQLLLNKYFASKGENKHICIHGMYNQGMIQLVESFQRENGLTVDGKIGPKTYNKLIELIESIP